MLLAQELLAHPGRVARVVVLPVARDGRSVFGDGHDLLLPLGSRTLLGKQRLDLLAGSARYGLEPLGPALELADRGRARRRPDPEHIGAAGGDLGTMRS